HSARATHVRRSRVVAPGRVISDTSTILVPVPMKHCLVPIFVVIAALLAISSAHAQEELCDASAEDCRTPLLNLINNERVGIDVGVWFFKDDRYVQALVRAKQRGVHVRVLMDTRANASYPTNAHELDQLKNAGIPMRRRTAGDILHWKLMIFDGHGGG